jgi:hypothetical protein
MLQAIPRPAFVVVKTVVIFSDKGCSILRPDVSGVILDHLGPHGQDFGKHIHPSRRSYLDGQSVSWEWNLGGEGWGESWYRDPVSGEIRYAWTESLEFIGRPLEEI